MKEKEVEKSEEERGREGRKGGRREQKATD